LLAALLLFCQDKFISFGDPQRIDNAVMNDVNDFFTLIKKHLRIYRFCLVCFTLHRHRYLFNRFIANPKTKTLMQKSIPSVP